MFNRKLLATLIILAPHLGHADSPKPTDRWKHLIARGRGAIIGDTPVSIPNLLPTLATDGIKAGAASLRYAEDGKSLVIDQTSTRLLGYWRDFNIGEDHSVRYVQPNADAVAVNLIQQESPSLILGSLDCNASCWLINPNGVFFGEHATVNARGLIAAAMEVNGLPMDGEALTPGQQQAFLERGLFDGIRNGEAFLVNARDFVDDPRGMPRVVVEGGDGAPRVVLKDGAYVAQTPVDGSLPAAIEPDLPRVLVKQGAQISSPGAPVLLAGPEVINEGDIQSDGGQIVLAGTRKDVYLAVTPAETASLRGFIVEVDSGERADGYRGAVINAGALTANLGNVTLVAGEIVQAGVISTSTAVDINGSVRIFARDRATVTSVNDSASDIGQERLALYLNNWEIANGTQVPIGTEGGDLYLSKDSVIRSEIDNRIDIDKLLPKLNAAPANSRRNFYSLLGVAGGAEFADGVRLGVIDVDYAFELAVAEGVLRQTDRFEVVTTRADSLARGNQLQRATGQFGDESQPVSKIHLEGRHLTFEDALDGESGSVLQAANADVSLRARKVSYSPQYQISRFGSPGYDDLSDASVTLGKGTLIDVSGTDDTVLKSERNTLEFFITSNELRNTPAQKEGGLLRETVAVDIYEGTSLFDWRAGFGTLQKSANERSATGGTIEISSTFAATVADGVRLDASGGRVTYAEGVVGSSRLIGASGFTDVADANADARYFGVVESAPAYIEDRKWGRMNAYRPGAARLQRYRDSYFEGFDAGSILIQAQNSSVSQGSVFDLSATQGLYQALVSGAAAERADAGRLGISTRALSDRAGHEIQIGTRADGDDVMHLDARILANARAGAIDVLSNNTIVIDRDTTLYFAEGSSLTLEAPGLAVEGDVRSLGGDLTFSQTQPTELPGSGPLVGQMLIGGQLDSSGAWRNLSLTVPGGERPRSIDAGDIRLAANDRMFINETAGFAANGGAALEADGELTFGAAGAIAILAEQDDVGQASELIVEGTPTISAVDNRGGGEFVLKTQQFELGAQETEIGTQTRLANDFFAAALAGGFHFEALSGNVDIGGDTHIELAPVTWYVDPLRAQTAPSADSLDAVGELWKPPAYLAPAAGLSITANKPNVPDTDIGILEMAEGARIRATPGSRLALTARTRMGVSGSLIAPGGDIALTLADIRDQADILTTPGNYLWLSDTASLDVAAVAQYLPRDETTGELTARTFAAGNIDLTARYGHVLIASDATLDLRGDTARIQTFVSRDAARPAALETLDIPLAAGRFSLRAQQSFNLQAQVDFGEPQATYRGGEMLFELNHQLKAEDVNASAQTQVPLRLQLTVDAQTDPFAGFEFGSDLDAAWLGRGVVTQKNLADAHIDSVTLDVDNTVASNNGGIYAHNPIEVDGSVTVRAASAIVLEAANLRLDNAELNLAAPYVQLGESDALTAASDSLGAIDSTRMARGSGVLWVESEWLDFFGNLGVDGAAALNLRAQKGVGLRSTQSVRGLVQAPALAANSLFTHGDIALAAPVLAAHSLANYRIDLGGDGAFALGPYGEVEAPVVSALAQVAITGARDIYIDSRIEVPFGELELRAAQSVLLGEHAELKVSGAGLSVPLGRIENDLSWTYPVATLKPRLEFDSVSGLEHVAENKAVRISAPEVVASAGSEIDLAAGGSFFAREFVQGLGGDRDVLAEMDYRQGFAILPSHQSGYTPFDYLEFFPAGPDRATIPWGTTVEISQSRQLAAGAYTVLPASYALVPGAFLVLPEPQALPVGRDYHTSTEFGTEVVAARLTTAGSPTAEPWQTYRIEAGETLARRARYRVLAADEFAGFDATAPGFLPRDNGRMALDVSGVLDFEGRVRAAAESSVGVSLDVTSGGRAIRITGTSDASDDAQALQVTEDLFADIGADSILLGGTRTWQDGRWRVRTDSPTVTFAAVDLQVSELLTVAYDEIGLLDAHIRATQTAGFAGNRWRLNDGGGQGSALLISGTGASDFELTDDFRSGAIVLDEASQVSAEGTLAAVFASVPSLTGLSFAGTSDAHRLQLFGESLDLSDAGFSDALWGLADDLSLAANGVLAVDQDLALQAANIRVRARSVSLAEGVAFELTASETLTLSGAVGEAPQAGDTTPAASRLNVTAAEFVLDGGPQSQLNISAADTSVSAADGARVSGNLTLRADGDLDLHTPFIAAADVAKLNLEAGGDLALRSSEGGRAPEQFAPAPILRFAAGRDLTLDTQLYAPAGDVRLAAARDLDLGDAAKVDLSPVVRTAANGETRRSWAGVAALESGRDLHLADWGAFVFGEPGTQAQDGAVTVAARGALTWDAISAAAGGTGGLDLRLEAATLGAAELDGLERLNAQGFDDEFAVFARSGDLDLGGRDFAARALSFTSDGVLSVAGALRAEGGERSLVLRGERGVRIASGSGIVLDSANGNAAVIIESLLGDLQIADGARVQSSGDIQLAMHHRSLEADTELDTRIATDGFTAGGELIAKIAFSSPLSEGVLDEASLAAPVEQALGWIDDRWLEETKDSLWAERFSGGLPDALEPLVALTAADALTVTAASGYLDLAGLRTRMNRPGTLLLRSGAGMVLTAGLSDGVERIELPSMDLVSSETVAIQRADDSWSLRIETGVADIAQTPANLTLGDGSFIRTGTGSIDIDVRGDLIQGDGSYIATVGQTLLAPEPKFQEYFGVEAPLLPVKGSLSAIAAWFANPDFIAGLGYGSGDVQLAVEGDWHGNAAGFSGATMMQRIGVDSDAYDYPEEGFVFEGLFALFPSLDLITAGVHSLGGNVTVTAGRDIDDVALSSPGQFFRDRNNPGDDIELAGGNIEVRAGGDIRQSSFYNIGGRIQVASREALGEGDDGLLVLGADTDVSLTSSRDLVIEAVANYSIVPAYINTRFSPLNNLDPEWTGSYFSAMDTSRLAATSVVGNLVFAPDADGFNRYVPAQQFRYPQGGNTTTLDRRYLVLPSRVALTAIEGDLELRDSMMLFPSNEANFNFFAGRNIRSGVRSLGIARNSVVIPDIDASVLPSFSQPRGSLDWLSVGGPAVIIDTLLTSFTLDPLTDEIRSFLHRPQLIDRAMAETTVLTAAGGDISADAFLTFRVPKALEVFAGGDLINTTFEIQHNRLDDLSWIRAEGDIAYPFQPVYTSNESNFVASNGNYIRIDGPGDLLVSAGGSIDLGATQGIHSLGAEDNPALASLSRQGANLHVYAGLTTDGAYGALVGEHAIDPDSLPILTLLFDESDRDLATSADWFAAYTDLLLNRFDEARQADYDPDFLSVAILTGTVARATGSSYFREYENQEVWRGLTDSEQRELASRAAQNALGDWQALEGGGAQALRTRIAVSSMAALALERPELFVAQGQYLFAEPPLGHPGFASQQDRSLAFADYWNSLGHLLALDYLLTPSASAHLGSLGLAVDPELEGLTELPLSDQLALVDTAFARLAEPRRMLVAEHVLTRQMQQSSREGAAAGNNLVNFARGYIAQRQFFGADLDGAIAGMTHKAALIEAGEVAAIEALRLGTSDGEPLAGIDDVFARWQADSAVDFAIDQPAAETTANISTILTTIQTGEGGGSVTLLVPRGSMDVGISKSQINNIGLTRDAADLGVLAKGNGDIHAVVADAFNVNESRTFTLAGGAVNLWSMYGDVDAGKGAKTILDTPLPKTRISQENGRIDIIRPPAVSGSGITSKESRSAGGESFTATQRFYALAEGAGPIFLSTPLGIVDAGEAGIQSAGDLFIAASKVVGADNISVGGASVGVVADTSVSGDVAAAGSSSNAATEALQSAVTDKASAGAEDAVTAFVTVEILDTGTTRLRRERPREERDDAPGEDDDDS